MQVIRSKTASIVTLFTSWTLSRMLKTGQIWSEGMRWPPGDSKSGTSERNDRLPWGADRQGGNLLKVAATGVDGGRPFGGVGLCDSLASDVLAWLCQLPWSPDRTDAENHQGIAFMAWREQPLC